MEIIKTPVENNIIKLEIGIEYNEEKKTMSGSVELDIENQSQFVDIINSIFDNTDEKKDVMVIVDMTNVSYIDSSGLWALFEGHKKASQRSGKMILLNPTKDVKRVLDITKMSSKIDIFDNERDAVKSLKK